MPGPSLLQPADPIHHLQNQMPHLLRLLRHLMLHFQNPQIRPIHSSSYHKNYQGLLCAYHPHPQTVLHCYHVYSLLV